MKYQVFAAVIPLTILLSACTTVEPAYKDIGSRDAPCISGGPDQVAQQFYDMRLEQPSFGVPDKQQLAKYRPWLSGPLYDDLLKASREKSPKTPLRGDLFSSRSAGATSASVNDSSTIPNTDARNIALRVNLSHTGKPEVLWQDEILMAREGTCWTVDDIRYLGPVPHITGGSLRQRFEE
ncbi:lipoprotein [Erwinia sp. S43]|uniref:Lipoprotein n=1 Tax=Pantoea coffeiphila TaxID=1465635 RepID=A0A2S9IAM4_9GAMM|nr:MULTISPECIES: lipoprotein [Erwiniaceae]MBK0033861.1 lipoprotein [Erwinia sp. S43]PRD14839.1 lipoprotein [Pantoea coffeiphila]